MFHQVGAFCLLLFVPVILSRFNEFLRIPSYVQTTMLGCLGTSILTGGAYRAATSQPGKLLLLFTLCITASVPFSLWQGGSFGVLVFEWLISLLVFFAISGSIYTFEHCRKAMYAMAIGGLLILAFTARYGSSVGGRFAFQWGTLQNPNDFATYLIIGLPFCLFVFLNDARLLLRLVAGMGVLGILVYGLKSGSRGAMVALGGIVAVLFFKVSMANKIKIVVAAAILFPVVLSFIPAATLERLATTFAMVTEQEREENRQVALAESSANARMRLVRDGLYVTATNPLLGVGPGQFQVAASRMAEEQGITSMWRETHDGYLQISSECGVPALLIYLALFLYCFKTNSKLKKTALVHPELAAVSNAAMCLFMACAILAFLNIFGSYGYTMLLPALCGFTEALHRTAQPVIQTALSSGGLPQPVAGTPVPVPAHGSGLPLARF
jgi:O-antigen ligase